MAGELRLHQADFLSNGIPLQDSQIMFSKEKQGLELLSLADGLTIPKVEKVYEGVQYSCLVLEYIESGPRKPSYWEELGQGLALLHSQNAKSFGLDHNNYIGSLRQSNSQHKD